MTAASCFSPALFDFMVELAANNDKSWFDAHRDLFIRDVRDPLLRFITGFAPRLKAITPCFVADPRPNGGSMFRIYRDIRFSKDKSPYKTHAAVQFRHESAGSVHAPGFYLHLAPGEVFVGLGLWHPEPGALKTIREHLVAEEARWREIRGEPRFVKALQMGGEAAKRPPAGFDPAHPLIEDLKRKDFICSTTLREEEACAPDFLDRFTELCQTGSPFMEFLTEAVGLPYHGAGESS